MRSHARASSAGSTLGQGSRLGRTVRGALAIRGSSSDSDGSGAPACRRRFVTLSLATALLAMALFASSAFASKQVISDFGTSAEAGSYGGELNNPRDVAVNEGGVGPANAGDAYVADEDNNRIERFDSSGNFVSAWGKNTISPAINERQSIVFEATAGEAALTFEGETSERVSYTNSAFAFQQALAALPAIGEGNVKVSGRGTVAWPFLVTFKGALGGADQPTLIADTSQLKGTAEITTIVNGSSSVPDNTGTGFEICTVAIECKAGVAAGENGALNHPQSVAVDQDTGNVYVSDRGNRRVDEYDGEGNFIRAFGWGVAGTAFTFGTEDLSNALGIAAYGTGDKAYVSAGNVIHVFGPTPARDQTSTFDGSDTDAGAFEDLRRIAVGQSSGSIYAIDNRNTGAVIDKFDSSGVAQDFSALGSSSLSGEDVTAPDGPVSFSLGGDSDIAVDNSGTATDGRIYVDEEQGANPNTVFAFAPDGTYLHKIALGGGDACGVAVDSGGNVWVANYTGQQLIEFDSSGAPTGTTISTQGSPCHFTIGDSDNFYVARYGQSLDQYDSSGAFQRTVDTSATQAVAFDPTSEDVLALHAEGVEEYATPISSPAYQVCEASEPCKAGSSGSGVGQYGEGSAENGFGIAVSPDGNSSTGTVYLADSSNRRVDAFDLDGANPASFGSSANFGEAQPRSVAVDSRGIVYASDSKNNGDVQRYDSEDANGGGVGFLAPIPAPNNERQEVTFTGFSPGDNFTLTCPDGTPTEELTYVEGEPFNGSPGKTIIQNGLEEACGTGNFSLSGEPPNVEVTFQGAFAAANQPQMTCTVLSGAGSCLVTTAREGNPGPLLPGSTAGLAVNPAGTSLYVLREPSSGPTVAQQFGPINEPGLTVPPTAADDTHGAAAGFSTVRGFGLNSASGKLYVSATNGVGDLVEAHRVYVLADSSALPGPTASVPSPGATPLADRTATFRGEVDPKGGLVSCKFQYSTDGVNWTDVKVPANQPANEHAAVPACAVLSENGGVQSISQKVSGLAPDTEYHLRLQVTRPFFSGFTPVTSNEVSFTTTAGLPVLSGVSAKAVDEHSVRVSAKIDPGHSPTTYVVQYGLTPSLGSSTAPVSVGAGTQPIEVSPVIDGLNPATQYYFKLVATNASGPAASDVLTVATYASQPSFGSCPNDRYRTGPSAKLPDCRAYEQVTPSDKYGSDAYGSSYTVEASPSGDGITSFTFAGFPGTEGFQTQNVFLSSLVAGKWSTAGLNTPPSYGDSSAVKAWTPDLALSFARVRNSEGGPGGGIVMRDSADGSRTVLFPQGGGLTQRGFTLGGTLDSHSKIVFEASGTVPVTSGAAPVSTEHNVYLYDRDTGELTLAGLLPDSACASPPCVPTEGSTLPAAFQVYAQDGHAVSPSGIYFADAGTGQLYLRRDAGGPGATTEHVSASQKTSASSPQPATFQGAIPDGSKAFFTSSEELTDAANTGSESLPGNDLYRYDVESGELIDLAPDSSNPNGSQAVGLLGYSDDGDYVYFAANGDLDGAGPAAAGDCTGSTNGIDNSFSGHCSAYLWQIDGAGSCASADGCISFIAHLDATASSRYTSDGFDWIGSNEEFMKTSRVSSDGHTLVFASQHPLTGYDNKPVKAGVCEGVEERCSEFYRYDDESGQITCLTCDPSGAPPAGAPHLKNPDMFHAFTSHLGYEAQPFLSRNLSPDGKHFFFQSADKLVPADVNGEQACPRGPDEQTGTANATSACTDVYEWEAPDASGGSCTINSAAYSPANGGCIYLLSTGTGVYPSYLADVSESGDTAFIFSRQQLVPFDEDTQEDIYAVKVDGGLAYQNAARPATCEGDACRGASSQPSNSPGAGSAVFEGPGNPKSGINATRCPKGKRTVHAKGKVRCVARRKKHAKHKSKRHHRRAANNDRRASR
ncbi:MAG: hypothetical protein ACRDLL_04350 [Solirubrobacterales bacterium]